MQQQTAVDRLLGDVVRRQARERPDRTALVFEGRETSFVELDRQASQVANALIAEGVRPGQRVALLAKNCDSFFAAFYGCAKAGAVLVPVNWRLAGPEVQFIIDDCDAEILFVGPGYYALIDGLLPQLPKVRRVVALTWPAGAGEEPPGWPLFDQWIAAQPDQDPQVAVSPDDDVVQLYSSGTTGRPKGVVITHYQNMAFLPILVSDNEEEYGIWTDADVNMVVMPLFHVGGLNNGLAGVYVGARTVILREANPGEMLRTIQEHKVTKCFVVPALILFLLQVPNCRDYDVSSLDVVWYGGSPIPLDLLKQAIQVFGAKFGQVYGMTESSGAGCYLPPRAHFPLEHERLKSCGKPASALKMKIVDAAGNELPPRQVGEILVASPTLMKGYWKRAEATAETIRDGWLHSGDAGYFDEEGYLYIYDRVKDMVVSGGENIYPAEVESALFGHPAIADVAVIGVPDARWGEAVKAMVVRKPGVDVTEAELIDFARQRIAGYKVPKSVTFVEEMPRNATGKILKRELRRPFWEGRDRQVH